MLVLRDSVGGLEAAVAPAKGGEMASLRVRRGGEWVETLWLARDYSPREGFGGKAPLLWPAVGRSRPADYKTEAAAGDSLPAGAWDWRGQRLPMPGHGFARDLPWEVRAAVADASGALVRLGLEDSAWTRERYPFGYRLEVEYALEQGRLQIRYFVRAKEGNRGAMPFSIGNHITFRTPLVEGSDPAQMTLIAPSAVELVKQEGVPTGEQRARSHANGIPLGDFEVRNAVSLTGWEGDPWVELRDPQGLAVRLEHRASKQPSQPSIQFNVWGDARDGYFSPEPWVGMQNSLNSGHGLIQLEPGEEFRWTVHVAFENIAASGAASR